MINYHKHGKATTYRVVAGTWHDVFDCSIHSRRTRVEKPGEGKVKTHRFMTIHQRVKLGPIEENRSNGRRMNKKNIIIVSKTKTKDLRYKTKKDESIITQRNCMQLTATSGIPMGL